MSDGYKSKVRRTHRPISKIIEEVLSANIVDPELYGLAEFKSTEEIADGISYRVAVAIQLVDQAARGNLVAIGMLMDRTEGKPLQINANMNSDGKTYSDFLDEIAEVLPGGDGAKSQPLIELSPAEEEKDVLEDL